MPAFLSDPPQGLYLGLAAALIITALIWLNRRSRKALIGFAAMLVITAIVALCDFLVQSPREAAVLGVKEISAAINARNWDAFEARISRDFNYHGHKKAELRGNLQSVISMFDARTAVWEFNRDKVTQVDDREVTIVFDAKGDPKSGAAYYAHFKATFAREADGQWRLKTFAVYPYASKTNGPEETLPGFH